MTQRVTIVGAGPGGLAAALLLARHGADVTVLERRDRVGGRCSTIEADGFRFDTGPTFFLYPRILEEIFAACGSRLSDHVELRRLDPMYRLVFEGGGDIRASERVDEMRRQIARLSPHDAENLPAFLEDGRRKLDAFRPVLETEFGGLTDYLKPDVIKALRYMRPLTSVDEDLSRYFDDERVRLSFSFQSKYLGMSPFRCPSLFTILSYLEYGHGVYHPIGGCAAVVEAMADLARSMGVDVRLGEEVRGIDFAGRKAKAVVTDGGRHELDALVINADFADAMTRLVPDHLRRRWTNARIDRKKFSCSTFMLWLGLEGEPETPDHHTIFLAEDYKRNIRQIEDGVELPDRPSMYVQNPSVTDPSLAPPGMQALYVLVPVPHQSPHIDWATEKDRYRELVLSRLAEFGMTDVRKRAVFEKVFTPADWQHEMHVHRGATFNLAHNLGQMLHLRPRNRFEDLDRVYLVGGGTHPGSGLPVIFEGARITTRLLAKDLGLPTSGILDTKQTPALEAAE